MSIEDTGAVRVVAGAAHGQIAAEMRLANRAIDVVTALGKCRGKLRDHEVDVLLLKLASLLCTHFVQYPAGA